MFKQFLKYFKRKNQLLEKANPPRIRVLDNKINRDNNHWKALIGREGIFLGRLIDEEGEVWDVKLDNEIIPHSAVNAARFEMIDAV